MSELFPTLGHAVAGFFPTLWRGLRCFGRGLKKLGRAMLYILPVLLVLHIIATLVTGSMLRREILRLTDAGVIVPREQLLPQVPEGERNAADVYQQAFESLRISDIDEDKLWTTPRKDDPELMVLAREVVAGNGRFFELLEEATSLRYCAFTVAWEDSPLAITFPHFAEMRRCARMLVLRSEVQAADGHIDEAVESCAMILRMSRHVQESPMIIGQLVGYAMNNYAVGALERVLSEGDPTAATCQGLFDQIADMEQVAAAVRAMRGELAIFGRPLFDEIRRGTMTFGDMLGVSGGVSTLSPSKRAVWRGVMGIGRPLINLDEIAYLGAMEESVEAFGKPWPEASQRLEALESHWEHQSSHLRTLTGLMMPVFSRFAWSRERTSAKLGAAQIALALTAYAAESGRYPDSLAELEAGGWQLPVDPFSQDAFHYRWEGEGFVVWSVGPDMDDDGGRPLDREAVNDLARIRAMSEEELRSARDDYDIPFRCER